MMDTYRIEMMTTEEYHRYMTGGLAFSDRVLEITASSADEAIAIAENTYPALVANKYYTPTLRELEAKRAETEKAIKDEAERKAQRKAKAEAKEREKAEAMDLTIEEYRAEQRKMKKIKMLEKQIAQLREELANAEKELNRLNNRG